MKPNLTGCVKWKQRKQKESHDSHAKECMFVEGYRVLVRDYSRNTESKWASGLVMKKTGPVSYQVQMDTGLLRRCHVDQLRQNTLQEKATPTPQVPEVEIETPVELETRMEPDTLVEERNPHASQATEPSVSTPVIPRRSN